VVVRGVLQRVLTAVATPSEIPLGFWLALLLNNHFRQEPAARHRAAAWIVPDSAVGAGVLVDL